MIRKDKLKIRTYSWYSLSFVFLVPNFAIFQRTKQGVINPEGKNKIKAMVRKPVQAKWRGKVIS